MKSSRSLITSCFLFLIALSSTSAQTSKITAAEVIAMGFSVSCDAPTHAPNRFSRHHHPTTPTLTEFSHPPWRPLLRFPASVSRICDCARGRFLRTHPLFVSPACPSRLAKKVAESSQGGRRRCPESFDNLANHSGLRIGDEQRKGEARKNVRQAQRFSLCATGSGKLFAREQVRPPARRARRQLHRTVAPNVSDREFPRSYDPGHEPRRDNQRPIGRRSAREGTHRFAVVTLCLDWNISASQEKFAMRPPEIQHAFREP